VNRSDPAAEPRWYRAGELVLLGLIGAVFVLHLSLIFPASVKGDEFRFLSDIYGAIRGDLSLPFQTFHAHLFRWLPAVGGTEVDQVIAARLAYYFLLLGSCAFVYLIGRRFLSRPASTFVVLCFLGFREVLATGTSFRFDGLSVFFLLGALTLLLRAGSRKVGLVTAGGLAAVALLVTMKTIFYLPTLALVVLLRDESLPPRARLRELAVFGATLAGTYLVLFTIHHQNVVAAAVPDATRTVQSFGPQMLRRGVLFPARGALFLALLFNPATWVFLLLGVVSLARRILRRDRLRESLLLASLLLPLLSLAIYRNAFIYYYVFVMPAVLVVAGLRFDEVLQRALQGRAATALPFLSLMLVALLLSIVVGYRSVLGHETVRGGHEIRAQRQTLSVVHRVFPEPVPYIDAVSMLASFPKFGFFMSSWGFEKYRSAGEPIFPTLLRREQPKFLLANHDAFRDVTGAGPRTEPDRLFDEDIRALRDNYIPHWGWIFVAGKRMAVSPDGGQQLEILVAGPYTIEAKGDVVLDGGRYGPGARVDLAQGTYDIRSPDGAQVVVLRWGVDLYRPAEAPLPQRELRGARPVTGGRDRR
jgi:hypothetical protein